MGCGCAIIRRDPQTVPPESGVRLRTTTRGGRRAPRVSWHAATASRNLPFDDLRPGRRYFVAWKLFGIGRAGGHEEDARWYRLVDVEDHYAGTRLVLLPIARSVRERQPVYLFQREIDSIDEAPRTERSRDIDDPQPPSRKQPVERYAPVRGLRQEPGGLEVGRTYEVRWAEGKLEGVAPMYIIAAHPDGYLVVRAFGRKADDAPPVFLPTRAIVSAHEASRSRRRDPADRRHETRLEQIERDVRRRKAQIRLILRHLRNRPFYGHSRYDARATIVVSPDLRLPGVWRVTRFYDDEAHGHAEESSFEDAVRTAVDHHDLDPATIAVLPPPAARDRGRSRRRDPPDTPPPPPSGVRRRQVAPVMEAPGFALSRGHRQSANRWQEVTVDESIARQARFIDFRRIDDVLHAVWHVGDVLYAQEAKGPRHPNHFPRLERDVARRRR